MGLCAAKQNPHQPGPRPQPQSRQPAPQSRQPARPPPAPTTRWTCAICTFINEAKATAKCAMCDQPKQVAQLQRAVSFSNLSTAVHLSNKTGEYGKLAQSAVSTAKLAINQQKKDGIIAQPPSGIVRANSLSDDAGNGVPGDNKPLSQLLRQQSLQIRFVNDDKKMSSGVGYDNEGKKGDGKNNNNHNRSASWQRKMNKDGTVVWLKPNDRRVHPELMDQAGPLPQINDNNNNIKNRKRGTSFVRALNGKGELSWLPAKDVKDMEHKSPATCGGVDSDLQYTASLPFEKKRVWFREACKSLQIPWAQGHIELYINRETERHAVLTSLEQVMQLGQRDMWKTFKVKFLNEDGDDAGGVSREWFTTISTSLFSNQFGLFRRSGDGDLTYQVNSHSNITLGAEHLKYFKFVGRLMGKALLNDIIVDAHFALPIYKCLLGLPIILSDMQYIDDGLYEKIKWLQTHSVSELNMDNIGGGGGGGGTKETESKISDVVKSPGPRPKRRQGQPAKEFMMAIQKWNVANAKYLRHKNQKKSTNKSSSSGMVFAYEYSLFGETKWHDLKPNGRNINVTDENKSEYVQLLMKYRMLGCTEAQMENLLIGFYEVIPPLLVSIFTFQEIELLLCGLPYIDVEDWEQSTQYSTRGCLKKNDNVAKWFWQIVKTEFSDEQRARLLQFSTGSANVPVGGFDELQTHSGNTCHFTIMGVPLKQKKYPGAHTCFNRLELPMYTSKKDLRQNLLVSIEMEMRLDLE